MKECLVSFPLDEDSGANSNFDWTNKRDSRDNDDDVDDDEMDSNFGTNSYDNLQDEFGTLTKTNLSSRTATRRQRLPIQ